MTNSEVMKSYGITETVEHVVKSYGIARVHPACKLFPWMTKQEFTSLCKSISEIGLLDPISVLDRNLSRDASTTLVDGKCRLLACYKMCVEPRFVTIPETEDCHIWAFVVDRNLHRTHYSPSQLAEVERKVSAMISLARTPMFRHLTRHVST